MFSSVQLALIAVWIAVLSVVVYFIIYPMPGIPAEITLSSVLLNGLTAPLLGPLNGFVAGFLFGWIGPLINPSTSIGPLTFLCPSLAALMSGLVLFDRWKEATLIFVVEVVIWFAHPFAWYQLMPIITWEYWLALIFIIVPPVRKWIINSVVSIDKKRLPIALWCLAWVAQAGGNTITGNNIAVWILGWGTPTMYPFWAPMTLYYAVADSLNCLAGAIIGAGVLLALKRRGISITAVDHLQSKLHKSKKMSNYRCIADESSKKVPFGFGKRKLSYYLNYLKKAKM
jgi:uncharacterized membrane protein